MRYGSSYTEILTLPYATVAEAKAGIGAWLSFYNDERQHQSLGYRTPRQIYQEGLWICGRSALPTGSASPASRVSSESVSARRAGGLRRQRGLR
jgi:putative transposase